MAKKSIDILISARDKASKKFVSLNEQVKKFTKNLAGTAMKKAFSVISRSINKLIVLFRRLVKISVAAFAGMATSIVFVGATFEKSMSRVLALTFATEEEFEALEAAAKKMGETTQFTARQAAEAMAELAKAGFEVNQIIEALPNVLNLAATSALDMGVSANIAAGIMKGMALETKDLGRVVDILAATFTGSLTDLEELGDAMQTLGPIAEFAGIKIEEVAAILGILADRQFEGEKGGTAMRNVLVKLSSVSGSAKRTLDGLITTLTEVNGEFRPIADIVEEIGDNLVKAGLTAPQKLDRLIEVLGLRAGPAFAATISAGAEAIREFNIRLDNLDDIAKRIADIQLDNLIGSFTKFKSVVEGVFIDIFEIFKTDLRTALDKFTQAIRDNKDEIIEWAISFKSVLADAVIFARKAFVEMTIFPKRVELALAELNLALLETIRNIGIHRLLAAKRLVEEHPILARTGPGLAITAAGVAGGRVSSALSLPVDIAKRNVEEAASQLLQRQNELLETIAQNTDPGRQPVPVNLAMPGEVR